MSEMIDRVARVIGAAIFRPQPDMSGDIWNRLGPLRRRACEDAARYAIEAMREPTRAMLKAVEREEEAGGYCSAAYEVMEAEKSWPVMIHAALETDS